MHRPLPHALVLFMVYAVSAFAGTTHPEARDYIVVFHPLAQAGKGGSHQKVTHADRSMRAVVLASLKKASSPGQGPLVRRVFDRVFNGALVRLNGAQRSMLAADPRVRSIERDWTLRGAGQGFEEIGLQEARRLRDPNGLSLRGDGIIVAVLDSGIDYTHPDLGGGFGDGFKVAWGLDLVNGDADPMDDEGHGTHVAGIIAASGAFNGIAPNVRLYAIKVLDGRAEGRASVIIAGIEAALDPDGDPVTDDGADILNLSLHGAGHAGDALALAVDAARDAGALVVVSAGNLGDGQAMGSPASARGALTVAALDGRAPASFSTRGPGVPFTLKPELSAPGVAVRSTWLGGGERTLNGTSAAAPHVSGAAALLMQQQPDWDVETIKTFLIHGAESLGVLNPFEVGAGRINLGDLENSGVLISPSVLNFGVVDPDQDMWEAQAQLRVINNSAPQTFTLSRSSSWDLPQGIALSIEPNSFNLVTGTAQDVLIRLSIDNSRTGLSPEPFLADGGLLLLRTLAGDRRIPTAFRKAHHVSFNLDGPHEGHVEVVGVNQRGLFHQGPLNVSWRRALSPGSYQVIAALKPLTGEGRGVLTAQTVTLDDDMTLNPFAQTHALTLDAVDQTGKPLEPLPSRVTAFVDHAPSDTRVAVSMDGQGIPFDAAPIAEDFRVQLVGHLMRPNHGDFLGFQAHFENGVAGPAHVSVDQRDLTPLHIVHKGGLPSAGGYLPEYRIHTDDGRSASALPFVDNQSDAAPFYARVYEPVAEGPAIYRGIDLGGTSGADLGGLVTVIQPGRVAQAERQSGARLFDLPNHVVSGALGPATPTLGVRGGLGANELILPSPEAVFRDGIGNGPFVENILWRITGPDDQTFETGEVETLRGAVPTRGGGPGIWRFEGNWRGRFRGGPAQGSFSQVFDTQRTDRSAPRLLSLTLFDHEGNPSDVLTADSIFELRLDEVNLGIVRLTLDVGDGPRDAALLESNVGLLRFKPPPLQPGTTTSIAILAQDTEGNLTRFAVDHAYSIGRRRIIPWVVNNQTWTSRIALFNAGDQDSDITLEALDRQGVVRQQQFSLGAGQLRVDQAADLFPDLSGYNLTVVADRNHVYPAFLTLTQRDEGPPSPSQTLAMDVDQLTNRLMFANIAGEGAGALVLSAPNQDPEAETPVLMTLHRGAGMVEPVAVQLQGRRPLALIANQLFPSLKTGEDAWITARAKDGTQLAGTTFSFNSRNEPSMAIALQMHDHLQVVPWMVNNPSWRAQLTLQNLGKEPVLITAKAHASNGDVFEKTLLLDADTTTRKTAQTLFPDLNGYSLELRGDGPFAVAERLVLLDDESETDGSPAQTGAVNRRERAERLLFPYLPGDQVPAIVLSAPAVEGETRVRLTAYNSAGFVDQTEITLQDAAPSACLLSDLFSLQNETPDLAVLIESLDQVPLVGVSFIFNQRGEPSLTRAYGLPRSGDD